MRHTPRKTNVNAKQCPLLSNQKHQHSRRLRGVSSTRTRALKQHALAVALTIAFAIFSSLSTAANTALDQTRTYQLNLPEQTVAAALTSLSEQTDIQVLFPYDIATQHQSTALVGNYPLQQALSILLLNTGLHGGLTDSGVITISRTGSNVDINQNGKGKRMNTNKRKTVLATMVGLFAAGGMSATMAQEQVGESARAQNVLDEIVVTAERREASMQDVPISITAFTGSQLEQSGITDTLDLEMVTPGLSLTTNAVLGNIFIRGIGSPTLAGPGAGPSASTYVDGVYQARFMSSIVDVIGIESVEVLKGPQGTLYGRNSTGGALKYQTSKPAHEFGGSLKLDVGNYDARLLSGTLDTPLIDDKLFLKTTVAKREHDGYTEVINTGIDNERDDLVLGRIALQYLPTDDLEILFHGLAVNDNGSAPSSKHFIDQNSGQFSSAQIIDDPRKVLSDRSLPEEHPMRARAADISVKKDFGFASLISITAYSDVSMGPFVSGDNTELAVFTQGRLPTATTEGIDGIVGDFQTVSQEFTLSSTDNDVMDWTVGVFYIEEDGFWLSGTDLPTFGFFARNRGINTGESYAGFGDITYSVSDRLRLNAGIRYSHETKEYSLRVERNADTSGDFVTQKESWSDLTSKVGVDYSFSDDVMGYLTFSEGFKSGAFNFAGGPPVEPEFITAYEVGLKSTLMDRRLRLNMSIFDYDYENLQVQAFNPQTFTATISNAAKASIQGLEVAATALVSESFRADIGLSWLDAEYDEFIGVNPVVRGEGIDLSGNKLPQAPEFTANIGLSYTHQVAGVGSLLARLDYYYSADKYFNEFNNQAFQDDYELINARIGLESEDGTWDVSVFGKNLTDELVFSSAFTSPAFYGQDGLITTFRPPRTYGVSVSYNF